mmetsp:Transcript_52616/g.171035  ORF Transcript_52616/g.171035 Transcript_52616/m.171035 type:complete len:286 (+) Transcript_52616:806-1663(+)
MLPNSATKQEAVAKRKSPTSVACRSPSRMCDVGTPRRNSDASRMSSCTKDAQCSTSMLAASDATRCNFSVGAPRARATSRTNAGRSRLPLVEKSSMTSFLTTSVSAGSESKAPSSKRFTSRSSRPINFSEPSIAAFGPPSTFSDTGAAGSGNGPYRPEEMRCSNSFSATLSRWKPGPAAIVSSSPGFAPSLKSTACSSSRCSSLNSPKLKPCTALPDRSSVFKEALHERSSRKARRRMPLRAPLSLGPMAARASWAERASHKAMSCDSRSSWYCANFIAQPRAAP